MHRENKLRFFAFIFVCISLLPAENRFHTDEDRLRIASDSLFSQILEEAGVSPASSVFLFYDRQIKDSFFQYSITQGMAKKNISVTLDSLGANLVLSIAVSRASIVYGETFSESFLGRQLTERNASVAFDVLLQDTSKIIFAISKSLSLRDTVFYSDVERFHSLNTPLALYIAPSTSFFDSIFEPIVVTVASGLAVYLFFTIRS